MVYTEILLIQRWAQMRPANARRIMISKMTPKPPLGKYPQPELYGQVGNAPTNRRIRIITRIVPMVHLLLYFLPFPAKSLKNIWFRT
jgi:hypothetical protein